jgi:hypothetical protein
MIKIQYLNITDNLRLDFGCILIEDVWEAFAVVTQHNGDIYLLLRPAPSKIKGEQTDDKRTGN